MKAVPTPHFFTGRHMLAVVLGFFAVVIAVNLTLAFFATRSWTGLVVENSYVASQHYNEELAQAHRQRALGWHGGLSYEGGRLVFRLRDAAGAPLPGMQVSATVRRPTHEGEDRELFLSPSAAGVYAVPVALMPGTWAVEVHALGRDGRPYRRDYRLWVAEETRP
ncbi:FixH family protein [Iodidimonas sp. SYSU 1G8]|uniref:FixH family protein n=1 Tax=Iodidimonas sp. SYSU 1G8 TaxID=3133967 RepID=UPI0031FF19C5